MSRLSPLRICYLAGTLGQGGAERQLFYALRALRQFGVAVRLLCLDQGAFWEGPIRQLGVRITWVGQARSRLKRLVRVIKEASKDRPDILQSQHFYTNAYTSMAGRLLHCAGIGAIRSNGLFDLLGTGRVGGRINLYLPRILAANSQRALRYAISRGVSASQVYLLPNVVDTAQFKPSPEVSQDTMTLLAVGRLTREKRLDRFLAILHRLRTEHSLNVRGIIVGSPRRDQQLPSQLERQAVALGLLPNGVEFRGSVSDMRTIYQAATVCVMTSDYEGTPNVLLEAMASGVPVVSTNVGGVPEIIRHRLTGFLVPRENIEAQTSAILELLQSRNLRIEIAARARAYVEQTHSLHRLPDRLGVLYDLALAKPYPIRAAIQTQRC